MYLYLYRDRDKYQNTRAEDKRHDESTSLTGNAYPPMRYPRHVPRSSLTATIANAIGNASRVARDSRSSELNALGDSALARPIASTTPLLVEPMADRTLSRLYLPVCAHLASVDPASGRWEDFSHSFRVLRDRSARLVSSLLFSSLLFSAFLSIVSLVTHHPACHASTLIVNKSSGGLCSRFSL